MNHTTLNVGSAMNLCAKYIVHSVSNSKVLGSILRISKTQRRSEQDFCGCARCVGVHSMARAHQGLKPRLKGLARGLAIVIGISLSMARPLDASAINLPINNLKVLADKQLTDTQYQCHNSIVYIESRFNERANNGSHWGYYQGNSISLKGASYDYQFYWYWYYVSKRYGITQYDEPNYCAALKHLKHRGWQ